MNPRRLAWLSALAVAAWLLLRGKSAATTTVPGVHGPDAGAKAQAKPPAPRKPYAPPAPGNTAVTVLPSQAEREAKLLSNFQLLSGTRSH